MFTICPKCTLTLVVTTVDLRAGQGYVRCGRCANVFNALIALREGDPTNPPSESARQRIIETAPPSPDVQPALGSGVALEPEPEPEPEPVPEPESLLEPEPIQEPEPEAEGTPPEDPAPEDELSFESADSESPPEAASLEFDATATDVSEIFVSPSQAEHDTGSGNYEAVVLAVEPPSEPLEPVTEPEPEPRWSRRTISRTPTRSPPMTGRCWTMMTCRGCRIRHRRVAARGRAGAGNRPVAELVEDVTLETAPGDPTWVQEMFAEAEAEAIRGRTAEQRALEYEEIGEDRQSEEPAVVQAARDVKGVSAPSGDTALEPLLATPAVARRPAGNTSPALRCWWWCCCSRFCITSVKSLVLNPSFGPLVSTVYGWFGATIIAALGPGRVHGETTRRGSGRQRRHASASKAVGAERQRSRAADAAGAPHAHDRYDNPVATRDLEPKEYLPAKIADRRLLEPDQRIDAELHVIDPGRAAVGFEIDACLRSESGRSAAPMTCGGARPADPQRFHVKIGPYELSSNVVLAPMAGVTDRPFRQLARAFGAGLAASEMITSDVRLWSTKKTRARMNHEGEPEPRVVQLAGADPEALADAARRNIDLGAQIIDINMGCPAKKVCNRLCGSALLTDENLVAKILSTVVAASSVPVTLKTRTGFSRDAAQWRANRATR